MQGVAATPWPTGNWSWPPGRRVAAAPIPSTATAATSRCCATLFIALIAGTSLSEHENPGEATVQVLYGRVRLLAGADSWDGREGDLIVIPSARHSLDAVENAVVLLTVAKRDD